MIEFGMFRGKGGSFVAREDREGQRYRPAFQPDRREMQPQERPPRYPCGAPYENRDYRPYESQTLYPEASGEWAVGGVPRKPRHTALWAFLALIAVAMLALMGYAIAQMRQGYTAFRKRVAVTQQGTFAQGILVDNIHIGGMTREQAEQALLAQGGGSTSPLQLTVMVDDETWVITENQLPFSRNISSVLDTAYAIGRQGTAETVSSSLTPFEYRYQHLYHTVTTPAYLYTQVTYDRAQVRQLVSIIENRINREAMDAQLESFDFISRQFTFTQEAQGALLDGEALYRQILNALDAQDYRATIYAQSTKQIPKVTRVELMNSFMLVSSFTTETTSDRNRNTNVDLACRAVSGKVVMPGEQFSFNGATGQRTLEKGYLPAAAIAGGTTVDEVGGGVCQVSSTLFNAAAMADMTIVSRSPHAWPSNYVDKGRDATVNWPNLDFVFRNDRDTPIFIVAYYQNRRCTVEIYGANLGPGEERSLSTQVVDTTYPPSEPLYEQNPLLPPGTIQEKKKARTGYIVETYKIYRRNGVEYARERLCTSNYKMIQQVLEWN